MRRRRNFAPINAFKSEIQLALKQAKQDPELGKWRIRQDGDGWVLEVKVALMDGTTKWNREYFSRRKSDVDKALARRS